MMKHCAMVLWASMIKLRKSDIMMEVDPATVMTYPGLLAKKWASTKFASFSLTSFKATANPKMPPTSSLPSHKKQHYLTTRHPNSCTRGHI
eukprot:10825962-Ditylum_brightwellii.AAC.1